MISDFDKKYDTESTISGGELKVDATDSTIKYVTSIKTKYSWLTLPTGSST
ncbi:hypothetical protein D3C76_1529560 [compost metagenome]